ncbi:MAG TPA: GNAT family N-acetyltransferase [Opitutaceae bacterium]|jgi:GNAT superfamily N-acetyltransferase|nr:GNAT family N-acetyltransferase [Opitutaceae bacterium]
MPHELQHNGYLVSDDPTRLDVTAIHAFLVSSYWAQGIPLETVERSLKNSLCFGAYTEACEQVGLARVISDFATFAWLADVYVLDAHRGHGLSKALMRAVVSHPRLQGLRRFQLVTRDAHNLYAQFGFTPLAHPARQMEKSVASPYLNTQAQA